MFLVAANGLGKQLFVMLDLCGYIKRHVYERLKIHDWSKIYPDLNGRVILPFRECFNFCKTSHAKFRENKSSQNIKIYSVKPVIISACLPDDTVHCKTRYNFSLSS